MKRAAALAIALTAAGCGERTPAIPVMTSLAPFELVDQGGQPFGSEELRGRVWVASFFFTHCPSVCPTLTSQMANLSRRLAPLGDRVHFVSVTVDPEVDDAETLRAYAARYDADLTRWTFLGGDPEGVRTALRRSFMVAVGARVDSDDTDAYDILHTARLMLVDAQGRLRGLYSTDAEGLGDLERDVGRLLDE